MMSDEGPVPGNARATLAALLASRGATTEARALAERVMSERDLIHHGAYGLDRVCATPRSHNGVAMALASGRDGFRLLSVVPTRSVARPYWTDSGFAAFISELRRSWEDARAKYAGGS